MPTFANKTQRPMKLSLLLISSLTLLLCGCSTAPIAQSPSTVETESASTQTEEALSEINADSDALNNTASEESLAQIETKPLTSPFIYRYLLAEIAGQRGDYEQSSHIFYQLAISEKDARFAERAAKVAAFGNVNNLVYPSVRLWAELSPESTEAQQAITEILINSNKIAEAEPHLASLLKKEKTRAAGFLTMGKLLNQSTDKQAVLNLVQNLAAPYPELAQAHIAIAQAAMNANQPELAISHLDKADSIQPGWNLPALLKGQILFQQSTDAAINFHEAYLTQYPQVNDVRLNFARGLVQHNEYERAKREFPVIVDNARAALAKTDALPDKNRKAKQASQNAAEKNLADTLAIIGLMAFQGEDFESANSYFKQALDFNYQDPDQIYLYLGQTAELLHRPMIARHWYNTVSPGKHYVPAQLNIGNQIKQSQSVDAAIEYLNGVDHLNTEEQTIITQSQAAMLNENKRYQDAFLLLKRAVEDKTPTPALVYDYALAAERVQEYEIMEEQLREVIRARPDYAPAYNALGYSFADRNIHLEEALALISRALELTPNDHYMLDSLGWAYFRLGKYDLALQHLQQAYEIQSDPEIAAHLGEVLWQMGNQEKAKEVWEQSLQKHPNNEILLLTIQKYRA